MKKLIALVVLLAVSAIAAASEETPAKRGNKQYREIAPPAMAVVTSAPQGEASAPNSIAVTAERVGYYVSSRVTDLVKIVRVDTHVGPGYGVAAQATGYLAAGKANYNVETGHVVVDGYAFSYGPTTVHEGGLTLGTYSWGTLQPRDPSEISLEAHVVGVGAGVGFSLRRARDFVAGLVDFSPPPPSLSASGPATVLPSLPPTIEK